MLECAFQLSVGGFQMIIAIPADIDWQDTSQVLDDPEKFDCGLRVRQTREDGGGT